MSSSPLRPPARRDFLSQLSAAAVVAGATAVTPFVAHAVEPERPPGPLRDGTWDMSWVDRLSAVPYRVVFDADNVADGLALYLAGMFMDQYHEVYGTGDEKARAVIVMRRFAVPMALGDALWARYAVGEDAKITDPVTKQPARKNPFSTAAPGTSPDDARIKLDALLARGAILLVCSLAANNLAIRLAEQAKRDVETVRAEVRGGLVPGAILMPSGVFATIRAQNAGCAYMRGA